MDVGSPEWPPMFDSGRPGEHLWDTEIGLLPSPVGLLEEPDLRGESTAGPQPGWGVNLGAGQLTRLRISRRYSQNLSTVSM